MASEQAQAARRAQALQALTSYQRELAAELNMTLPPAPSGVAKRDPVTAQTTLLEQVNQLLEQALPAVRELKARIEALQAGPPATWDTPSTSDAKRRRTA